MNSMLTYFFGLPGRRFGHLYLTFCTALAALAIGGTLAWLLHGHAPDAIPETGGTIAVFLSMWILYFMQDRNLHLSFSFGFGAALVYFSSVALKLGEQGRTDMANMWAIIFVAGSVIVHRVLWFDRLPRIVR